MAERADGDLLDRTAWKRNGGHGPGDSMMDSTPRSAAVRTAEPLCWRELPRPLTHRTEGKLELISAEHDFARDGKGRSRAVRLGFQCSMRENKLFLVGHNSHLVPVIRKFLAAFQANHICARQVRGTRTALAPLYALRESRVQVPATEQQVE